MRTALLLAVVSLGTTLVAGDEVVPSTGLSATPPHPRVALQHKAYTVAMERAKADYEKTVKSARDRYLRELDLAVKGLAKSGDLEGARAVEAEMKTVAGGQTSDPVGKWTYHDYSMVFREDGTVERSNVPGDQGRWNRLNDRDFEVRFASGKAPYWIITLTHDGNYFVSVRYADDLVAYVDVHKRVP